MKKSFNILLVAGLTALSVILASCTNDEIKKPEILEFELGHENGRTAFAGGDLHIDAQIIAENGIDRIDIEIHYESDHQEGLIKSIANEEWAVSLSYDEYRELKNTIFHKDIDVPYNIIPGTYHFQFVVIDLMGYTADFSEDIEILTTITQEDPKP